MVGGASERFRVAGFEGDGDGVGGGGGGSGGGGSGGGGVGGRGAVFLGDIVVL